MKLVLLFGVSLLLTVDAAAQQTQVFDPNWQNNGNKWATTVPANALPCVAASGSSTAYTCTTSPAVPPVAGTPIQFRVDVTSGTSPTLNVNSATPSAEILKQAGSVALVSSDLLASQWVLLIFDGTNWQMQGQLGNASSGGLTSVGLSTTASWFTVGNSPLTANGTITINPTVSLTQNEVLATPNGSSGAVGLRALVSTDIPMLNQSTTGNAATATALASAPTTCTTPLFSLGIAANGNASCIGSQTANFFYASPNGSSGTPTFRALASADIPNNAANTTGTAAALTATPTTCTSGSAPLGVLANGNATGCTSITSGGIAPGNVAYLTANSSGSASATLVTAGMTFSIAASTNYTLECMMYHNESATSGVGFAFGVSGPGTPTGVTLHMFNQTTQTAFRSDWQSGTAWGAAIGATATTYDTNPTLAHVTGLIQNGTTAGTLTIEYANIGTTGTVTLYKGSWCRLQ